MFETRLPRQTYLLDPFEIAREHLLGAYLCSVADGRFTAGMITELEVYLGACDRACHAYPNKLTPRTSTMFKAGGCAYVFFVYGMYHQFNVVVSEEGTPNAILIRALEPVAGIPVMQERRGTDKLKNLTTGPGKLCQALGITRQRHDGIDLSGTEIWLSPRQKHYETQASKRIGIDYAGPDSENLWRFTLKNNPFVSKR